MTAPAVPWRLDRLSTTAREAAPNASLAAGVSLSSLLGKLICDTCAAEGIAAPAEAQKSLDFTHESDGRIPSADSAIFRASTMVVAPVSAFRPLRTLKAPGPSPGGQVMSRNVPPLAAASDDRWERLEIDPATRRLAEAAAAAAGLSVEEWLDRAIRRACPTAFGSASATTRPTVVAARLPEPSPTPEPPIKRAPTIAERLTQQRFEQAEAEKAAPSFVRVDDNRAAAQHSLTEHDSVWDVEPAAKTKLTPGATANADDLDKLWSHLKEAAANAQQLPSSQKSPKRLAIIAVAIALSITAGAVTAQYLIPGRTRAPAAPSHSVADATPNVVAPSPNDPRPLPGVNDGSNPVPANPTPVPAPASLASLPVSPTAAPSVIPPAAATNEASAPTPPRPTVPAKPEMSTQAKPAAPPKESAPGKIASTATAPRTGKDDVAPSDPKSLASWLDQRAKNGDAIAQYRLGVLYALGQGVRQDYQHAALLFKAAAEGGVAEAQYNLGVLYERGLGIGRDEFQAAQWYQKAAAQGNANAAFNLGVAYSNGAGVQQSMAEAAQLFRRAGAAGIVNAQFNLGLLYERGDGVPVSQVEAYAWYSAAATRGDTGAAQRRDRLASLLAPAALKEAKARAEQVAAAIKSVGNSAGGGLAAGTSAKAAATKP